MSKDWKARVQTLPHETIPENMIKVTVGFKPNPFFDPEWVKQGEEKYREVMKRVKEMDQERLDRIEQLKKLEQLVNPHPEK
jgi:hypothetical protein